MINVVFDNYTKGILKQVFTPVVNVVGLSASLDVGKIDCLIIGAERRKELRKMFLTNYSDDLSFDKEEEQKYWNNYLLENNTLLEHAKIGDAIRIWGCDTASSLCGYYYVVHELMNYNCAITLVKLPEWSFNTEQTKHLVDWNELPIEDWPNSLLHEYQISMSLKRAIATEWIRLKKENAPLRVSINNRLYSANDSFYDGFILSEVGNQDTKVSQLIICLMKKYRFGLGDWFFAERIQVLLKLGKLICVQESPWFYNNIIRKETLSNS